MKIISPFDHEYALSICKKPIVMPKDVQYLTAYVEFLHNNNTQQYLALEEALDQIDKLKARVKFLSGLGMAVINS